MTAPRDPFAGHTPTRRDPRGECRRITSVLVDPNGGPTIVGYNCGHYSPHNQIFSYRVNDDSRCMACGADLHAPDLLRERDAAIREVARLERYARTADDQITADAADNATLRARVGQLKAALADMVECGSQEHDLEPCSGDACALCAARAALASAAEPSR